MRVKIWSDGSETAYLMPGSGSVVEIEGRDGEAVYLTMQDLRDIIAAAEKRGGR